MDVKTAFLNGNLDERIFMAQPNSFVEEGQETKVCELLKSIYGLKQAYRSRNIRALCLQVSARGQSCVSGSVCR